MKRRGEQVQAMFAEIAPRYDFLNRLLSFGTDQRWRRRTVEQMALPPEARVLDFCCGTGDLALAFARQGARVVGSDFAGPMLPLARRKAAGAAPPPDWVQADAQHLPFRDDGFDGASVAFGIRNVEDPRRALGECARVLRPGGRLAVLEFFRVRHRFWGPLFRFYFHRVLPLFARVVAAGRTGAYQYLPASVEDWASPEEFEHWMQEAGFARIERASFSGGVAHLIVGTLPGGPGAGGAEA